MRILFLCILCILFNSCNHSKEDLTTQLQLLEVPSVPSNSGFLQNHFEIAEIVPIQTTDDFLITNIKRVIRHKDRIILLSGTNNAIFIINENGIIENSIHKIGNGPGESNFILDIAFDDVSEQIIVYNDYSKLLFFNLQGQFLSEVKVDGLYEGICFDKGNIIFHNKFEGYARYPYMLKVYNIKDETWEEFGRKEKLEFPISSNGCRLVRSKQIWFSAPVDFTLFTYRDKQIQTPYGLEFKTAKPSEDLIKKSISNFPQFLEEINNNNLTYSVHSIRETTDYIVFCSNRDGLFTIDKKTNTIYWDRDVEAMDLGVNLTSYFPHEGDDDKIMFILQASTFIQHRNINPSENIYLQKIQQEDNPILIFYKQKE